jgi:outer membrane protein
VMKYPILATLLLASAAASASGLTLADAWRGAMAHDPKFAAAQAQRDVGRARRSEGKALWLPTLSATGSAGRNDLDSRTQGAFFSAPGFGSTNGVDFQTNVNGGTATHWALIAEQPLFDSARFADSTAQKDAAQMSEAQFRSAEQDLMLRSAKAYFDVLNTRAQLQALVRLRASAEKARLETQARYDAGDLPVTDLREAQANADTIDVQELDARSAVTLSEAAFTDLTGLDATALAELTDASTAEMPAPDPLASWTQRAVRGSPLLVIQHLAVTTATAQVGRYDALTSPRVSLVAQIGRDSLHGSGDFGPADITGRQAMIGLQATIPLYTGGMRSAQRHEAKALEHQAEAELDGADQQVRQQTRAAWLSLTTAATRVIALERLRGSAGSRRDATRLGSEIGGRTALELLVAEADYQRAGADLQRAQSDWFVAGLQLKAVAGELAAADLEDIDHRLGSTPTGAR